MLIVNTLNEQTNTEHKASACSDCKSISKTPDIQESPCKSLFSETREIRAECFEY